MSRSLSVLVLAPFLPWPLLAGNRVRLAGLVEELASQHAVTLVLQTSRNDKQADVADYAQQMRRRGVRVIMVEQPYRDPWTRLWMKGAYLFRGAVAGTPMQEHYLNNRRFRLTARRVASSGAFDVVVITYFACGVPEILECGIPVVCDASDILWVNASTSRGVTGFALERLKQRETAVFERCSGIICVHAEDESIVRAMVDERVPTISLAHLRSLDGLSAGEPRSGRGRVVTFYGDLGSPMNRDALTYLTADVWPLVHRAMPDSELVVFGSHGFDMVKRLHREGIRFLGVCDDLASTLLASDLVVLPLRFGSGIKGRVLECMESGVPVVGTSAAFEGIPLRRGEDALWADDAEGLAEACVALLADGEMRHRVSRSGRRFFEATYAHRGFRPVHEFLERVVDCGNC